MNRKLVKNILDLFLNPFGLSLQRYFGESPELAKIINIANTLKVDTLLDVGANVGQFAQNAFKKGYNGKVISFEPTSNAYLELIQNAREFENWDIFRRGALGDFDGTINMNVSKNSYSSSLLNVTKHHLNLAPDAMKTKTEEVLVFKLDSIYKEFDFNRVFLKLDVQGYEDRVINGSIENVIDKVVLIQTELSLLQLYDNGVSFFNMIDLLHNFDFEPLFFSPGFLDRTTNEIQQLEGFFIKKTFKNLL